MNPPELTANEKRTFQADRKAWAYFERVAPSYQQVMLRWVVSASQASTRAQRLEKLIAACAEARKLI